MLSSRILVGKLESCLGSCRGKASEHPGWAKKFGRKCLVVSATSILFVFSCFYRSVNIADEGAATCRGTPTAFNAPVSGRFVATIGEVALVVQIAVYIRETSQRLQIQQGRLWAKLFKAYTSVPFSTIVPACAAECLSWSGLLSGNSKFFCAEYVMWMIIAVTWAWDGAELLNKSKRLSDQIAHGGLLLLSLGLFFFNAFVEIPHFFRYHRGDTIQASISEQQHAGIWECYQREESPLWFKRLPFFVCYFIGSSWCSVAITYRFVKGGNRIRKRLRKQDHGADSSHTDHSDKSD